MDPGHTPPEVLPRVTPQLLGPEINQLIARSIFEINPAGESGIFLPVFLGRGQERVFNYLPVTPGERYSVQLARKSLLEQGGLVPKVSMGRVAAK